MNLLLGILLFLIIGKFLFSLGISIIKIVISLIIFSMFLIIIPLSLTLILPTLFIIAVIAVFIKFIRSTL